MDIAYPVVGLDPETDDVDTGDAAGDVNFDTYRFDELCCRDCGFSSSDVSVFLP